MVIASSSGDTLEPNCRRRITGGCEGTRAARDPNGPVPDVILDPPYVVLDATSFITMLL